MTELFCDRNTCERHALKWIGLAALLVGWVGQVIRAVVALSEQLLYTYHQETCQHPPELIAQFDSEVSPPVQSLGQLFVRPAVTAAVVPSKVLNYVLRLATWAVAGFCLYRSDTSSLILSVS